MQEQLELGQKWLAQYAELDILVRVLLLLAAAWLANFVVKKILLRGVLAVISYTPAGRDKELFESNVIARIANVVPALVISYGVMTITQLPAEVGIVVRNVCNAFIVLTLARAISGILTVVNTVYERRPDAHQKPIKGYIQVVKIGIYAIAAILVIAA